MLAVITDDPLLNRREQRGSNFMATINRNRNELLLTIMEKRHLSKQDVAKKLGHPVTTIEKWIVDPTDELFEEIPEKEIQFLMYDVNFDIYEVHD